MYWRWISLSHNVFGKYSQSCLCICHSWMIVSKITWGIYSTCSSETKTFEQSTRDLAAQYDYDYYVVVTCCMIASRGRRWDKEKENICKSFHRNRQFNGVFSYETVGATRPQLHKTGQKHRKDREDPDSTCVYGSTGENNGSFRRRGQDWRGWRGRGQQQIKSAVVEGVEKSDGKLWKQGVKRTAWLWVQKARSGSIIYGQRRVEEMYGKLEVWRRFCGHVPIGKHYPQVVVATLMGWMTAERHQLAENVEWSKSSKLHDCRRYVPTTRHVGGEPVWHWGGGLQCGYVCSIWKNGAGRCVRWVSYQGNVWGRKVV